jgi:hypothetical protein
MVWGIFKADSVSEAYKKMKAEELKGNQHKLDHDKDGKIEGEDLAKLRAQKEKENSMKYGKDVKEEAEQIDEISKKTLGSYVSKASVDMANRTADATQKKTMAGADYAHDISRGMSVKQADANMKKDYDAAKPDVKKAVKRMHGINKAVNRLTKEDVKEEAEQIDELSKGTLASYAKKASHDSRMNQKMSKDFELDAKGRRNKSLKDAGLKLAGHYQKKSWKRQDGVNKAIDRLAKEDYSEEDLDALINEVLSKDATAGDWISDFVKSDNPKFAGKSKEKRKEMALAAYYAAQKKESTDYDSFIELVEEKDLVKTGSKEIKHANIKDKEDDKDDFGPRAQGEKDFLDKLSVDVTDDPAGEYKSGAEGMAVSSKPTGKYSGEGKTGIKKESTSEENYSQEASGEEATTIEEASCGSTKAKGKKTFSSFKEEMKTKKA